MPCYKRSVPMKPLPATGPVTLEVNIAEYENTKAIRSGEIKSDKIKIDFCGPAIANQGFKPMVRDSRFHASELAMVSFLQAREVDKPLVLCPIPILSRFQHYCISYNTKVCGELKPKDIEGKRIIVRSYSQTTAMWVRSILKHTYGVDLSTLQWYSYDDPHPAEVKDPPFVNKLVMGDKTLDQMFLEGEYDAAIVGYEYKEPHIKTLIPDPHNAAVEWYKKYGIIPVNHFLVVNKDVSQQRPDAIKELVRMLAASKKANPLMSNGIDLLPFGFDACYKTVENVIMYAREQGLITRKFTVEELFDENTMKLGAD